MNIRTAVSADNLLLSSLCVDVQSLHAKNHPEYFKMPQSDNFAAEFFQKMLADPTISIFVAETEERALGYVVCKLIEREETPFSFAIRYLLVDQISVRPTSQGQGIGNALLGQVEELAKEMNVSRIQLDSWSFNIEAHRFFENFGFEKFKHLFWKNL